MRPLWVWVLVLASGCVAGADRGSGLDAAPREHPTEADAMAAESPELVDEDGELTGPEACDGVLESGPIAGELAGDAEEARARFVRGAEAFAAGDYVAALEAFCDAHRLYPAPPVLFNVAVTFERLGRSAEAAACYQAFAESTDSPIAEEARRRAAALRDGEHAP